MIVEKELDNLFICECEVAKTLLQRTKGLIGRKYLAAEEGILILNCHSVHSFFMKFGICVVFLDKDNRIIKVINNFKRNKMSKYYFKAKNVLELPAFSGTRFDLNEGEVLVFKD